MRDDYNKENMKKGGKVLSRLYNEKDMKWETTEARKGEVEE